MQVAISITTKGHWGEHFWCDTKAAPPGYLDPYPQVFKCQNPYLDPQRFFPMDHLDPQVKNLWVTGTRRSPIII